MNAYEQHMKELAVPMRKELTDQGFLELKTEDNVNDFMKNVADDSTTFVMVNSICGCAAGIARPAAVTVATQNPIKPDHLITVFAGQDKEATESMREFIMQAPSSPSFALFKGQNLVHFIPRSNIEGREIEDLMADIKESFDSHCS